MSEKEAIDNQYAVEIKDLHAWYDEAHILHGINLQLCPGECVALLGRNGAGRTTTLGALIGIVSKRQGSIKVNGRETIHLSPDKIAHMGIGYCPQGHGIFGTLSCEENLWLPQCLGKLGMSNEDIYSLFPSLKNHAKGPGGKLSGGEQQMLEIARILHAGSPILLFDEISEGLSPVIVQSLTKLILELKKRKYSILMVEQNFRFVSKLADRIYIIEHGRVIDEVLQKDLISKKSAIEALLGV